MNIYTVEQVNEYIKNIFARNSILSDIQVKGEISNCKYHTSGHIYFTLKDKNSAISCVMFSSDRQRLTFTLQEGVAVVVRGIVSVYPRDGKYQIYAKEIAKDGVGILYQQFEELKYKLEAKGYFETSHKKRLPSYVKRVGIVTAKTGAAIQDIINVSKRRNPYVELILYPAKVQGVGAALTVAKGIERLDKLGLDVIIIGRGGGSIEELWCFNEEIVAEAIYKANTPIISAVGHETDFTIADFVADHRAPTPSAAAEIAVFDYNEFQYRLSHYRLRLDNSINRKIISYRNRLRELSLRLRYQRPDYKLLEKKNKLKDMTEKLKTLINRRIELYQHRINIYEKRLEANNPKKKLDKGFAFASNVQGEAIISINQLVIGDKLILNLSDGIIKVEVQEVQ